MNDPNYYRYLGKGNRFSWTQTNGTTLTLDNFSTQDGPQGGNDYGLNIDLALDVARTAVRDDDGNLVKLVNGEYVPFSGTDSIAEKWPTRLCCIRSGSFQTAEHRWSEDCCDSRQHASDADQSDYCSECGYSG